jgi:hypothetical protein
MVSMGRYHSTTFVTITVLITVGIFMLDVQIPLGIAVPVLYLLPFSYVILWSVPRQRLVIFIFPLIVTGLTLVALIAKPGGDWNVGTANRLIILCVMWAITVLALVRKQQDADREVTVAQR